MRSRANTHCKENMINNKFIENSILEWIKQTAILQSIQYKTEDRGGSMNSVWREHFIVYAPFLCRCGAYKMQLKLWAGRKDNIHLLMSLFHVFKSYMPCHDMSLYHISCLYSCLICQENALGGFWRGKCPVFSCRSSPQCHKR